MSNNRIKVGNTVFPLETNTANAWLKDMDPALSEFCNFIARAADALCLDKYKEGLEKLRAKGKMSNSLELHNTNKLVQQVIPYALTEELMQTNLACPFISVEKVSSAYKYNDNAKRVLASELLVTFTLPGMNVEQFATMQFFLDTVSKAIAGVVFTGRLDQVEGDQSILDLCNLDCIQIGQSTFGRLESAAQNNTFMPCVVIGFTMEELLTAYNEEDSHLQAILNIDYELSSIVDEPIVIIEQRLTGE